MLAGAGDASKLHLLNLPGNGNWMGKQSRRAGCHASSPEAARPGSRERRPCGGAARRSGGTVVAVIIFLSFLSWAFFFLCHCERLSTKDAVPTYEFSPFQSDTKQSRSSVLPASAAWAAEPRGTAVPSGPRRPWFGAGGSRRGPAIFLRAESGGTLGRPWAALPWGWAALEGRTLGALAAGSAPPPGSSCVPRELN